MRLPSVSSRSSTLRAEALAREPVTESARLLAMRLADRDDARLHGREPEREVARVVLDEDPDEPLERPEERAVDHDRHVLAVVRRPCT